MADDDVATKAPESDAAEQSVFSGDTKADQGASMGEHCTTDRPTPEGEKPTGELTKLDDVDVYITKPADYPHAPSKLLLLLTGGTGVRSTNNQLQADRYAAEGFLVVMPDQFNGDPAPTTSTAVQTEQNPSLIETVKMRAVEVAKSFTIDMWLARHTPATVLPVLHRVLNAAKDEFADAVANGGGVYAVGYCFGAKYVLMLGSELPDTVAHGQKTTDEETGVVKKEASIKCGAIAHGTMVTREDLQHLQVPTYLVCVEGDSLFPDDVREEGVKSLQERKVEHEVKLYSNVPHGFAVYGDYADSKIKEAQTEAFGQMLGWLKAH
ncbi:hypothetical protein LTR66_009540 [Elasticomyces elasticus]|nr:hypothetical protein LTR66_009540 [Elasticomyces elasticus]